MALTTESQNPKAARRHSIAWFLLPPYLALLFYASLYPFLDWRMRHAEIFWFFGQALGRIRWQDPDVVLNILGYVPLGFLLALALLRSLQNTQKSGQFWRRLACFAAAVVIASVWSASMESLQTFLPTRVPSKLDWVTNTFGAAIGALIALAIVRIGLVGHWHAWRSRWLVGHAQAEVALLVSWPIALLPPTAVPLGLGQVGERFLLALGHWGIDLNDWLGLADTQRLSTLSPLTLLICTTLGLIVPALLSHLALRTAAQRLIGLVGLLFAGWAGMTVSAVLSFGPAHAWAWWSLNVQTAWVIGSMVALACAWLKPRALALIAAIALVWVLAVLNQASSSAYFWQTLQTWEQGRFIQFHGVAQWLGWLWPFAALVVVLQRIFYNDPHDRTHHST